MSAEARIQECLELLSACLVEKAAAPIEYPGRLRGVQRLLAKHSGADQAARLDFDRNYYRKHQDPAAAIAHYRKDKGTGEDDVFGDHARASVHQPLLKKLPSRDLKALSRDPNSQQHLFLLGQHADNDVALQKRVSASMPKRSQSGRMMKDRIAVNTGQPQRYGTQGTNDAEWEAQKTARRADMKAQTPLRREAARKLKQARQQVALSRRQNR